MESNTLKNSMKSSVASNFLTRTPSIIWRIVKICEVAEQFFQKQFQFFI